MNIDRKITFAESNQLVRLRETQASGQAAKSGRLSTCKIVYHPI